MGLRAANRPIVDDEGYASGVVVSSKFEKATKTLKVSRDDVDAIEYERLAIHIQADGTAGPINMRVYAGNSLNGVLEESGRGKSRKAIYNRLTGMALNLKLVEFSELEGVIADETIKRVESGLLALEGEKVRFKLGKVEGQQLLVPLPETLTRVE